MKSYLAIIFGSLVLFTDITQAERKDLGSDFIKISFLAAPNCEGRPDFITEVRSEIIDGFMKLPSVALVAKEAEYYIESKNTENSLKIHSFQSFLNPKAKNESKIICGQVKGAEAFRFSLFAPTLIDMTRSQRIGQSFWQFQLLTDKEGFSIWNKRSLAFIEGENIEKALMKFGGIYRIYKLSHDQYEVVVSKDTGNIAQYLSVKYDVIR
ncbi:MAG: hypothetical protein ACXWRE_01035 [Pseudobdellovibrionaceae bacterium]